MKQIPLTQGKFALVDDEDFEWLNQWKWYARRGRYTFYAQRRVGPDNNRKNLQMHRLILKLNNSKTQTDHKDRNGLNNQRHNLRKCTYSENNTNRRSARNSSSKYLGVSWNKRDKKWRVTVSKNYKICYMKDFKNEIDAAKAYNEAAKKYHGEFAFLNAI